MTPTPPDAPAEQIAQEVVGGIIGGEVRKILVERITTALSAAEARGRAQGVEEVNALQSRLYRMADFFHREMHGEGNTIGDCDVVLCQENAKLCGLTHLAASRER